MPDQTSPMQPSSEPAPALPVEDPTLNLDDIIERYIGDFGWKQFLQSTFVSLALFFDAYHTFITIFTDVNPKWSFKNSTNVTHTSANICDLPPGLWSWDLPAHSSIISQWSLQCASAVIKGLPTSFYFMGCLVGALVLGTLADSSLGRKNLLVVCCMIMSVSAALTSISVNVWMYSALRFVSGFGRGAISICSIVLASELTGKKWRDRAGIFGFVFFALGFLCIPIIAYLLKGYSWRFMYLTAGIPGIIYSLLVYFLVHESPRWLFIRKNKKEFVKTLKSLSRNTKMTENLSENFQTTHNIDHDQEQDNTVFSISSSLKELLKKRWALRRVVLVTLMSVGSGMTYYGMPLGLGNLSANLYISTILNAIIEIPSSVAVFIVIKRSKRKRLIIGSCVLSGICGLGSVWMNNKGIQLGLELMAFFSCSMATGVLTIYSMELFPTCIRNTAGMAVRVGLVIGGAISPTFAAVSTKRGNGWVSYTVFGVAILGAGVCVMWLPETRGIAWSDTMDEEEKKNDLK